VISGRIAIRRAGHVLYEDWMTRLVSPNATNAFQDEIHLRPHWTGHLVAQFTIRIGDTIARRSIDFDVKG
jgi:hypothetical protein